MRAWILRVVVALIAINAALGVTAVLVGDEFEGFGRVLASSLLATAGAIVAMTCAPAWSERRLGWVPQIGVATSIVGFGLLVGLVWSGFEPDPLVKAAVTAVIVAVASALASLLSGWPVPGGAWWLPAATYGLVAATAGLLVVALWGEVGNDVYWRVVAALAVLMAGASLATPILSRFGGPKAAPAARVTACPICSAPLDARTGTAVTCPECGVSFEVRMVETS